jgi:hypothetical protein
MASVPFPDMLDQPTAVAFDARQSVARDDSKSNRRKTQPRAFAAEADSNFGLRKRKEEVSRSLIFCGDAQECNAGRACEAQSHV